MRTQMSRWCALAMLAASNVVLAQGLPTPVSRVMDAPAADLVLENGQVYTPSGWASSIAIGKGTILAVGNAQTMKAHRTSRTRVIDLRGDTVFPGLNDAHVHVMWGGAGFPQKPLPTAHAERVAAIQAGVDAMLSFGVTSFNDALSEEDDMKIFAALADAGKLKQRVKICIRWDGGEANAAAEALIKHRRQFARQRIDTNCVKLYTDGAPMARTSRMLEPYEGDPHNFGAWTIPPEQLKQLVQRFDASGLTLKIHATGDESARAALDAIGAARRANGWSGALHEVAHNSFVAMSDLQRGRAIGATFEFSPFIWYPTPLEDVLTRKTVGDVRMERVHPVRDAIDAGALVVGGSDWPFTESVSPWLGIETLVTRRTPGGGDRAVGEKEAISLREAIDMFTVNAATARGVRDQLGAIEPGLIADLVVLDRNPVRIPITEVHRTRAKRVFIEGELVYDSGS